MDEALRMAARIMECEPDQLPVGITTILKQTLDNYDKLGGRGRLSRQVVSMTVALYQSANVR